MSESTIVVTGPDATQIVIEAEDAVVSVGPTATTVVAPVVAMSLVETTATGAYVDVAELDMPVQVAAEGVQGPPGAAGVGVAGPAGPAGPPGAPGGNITSAMFTQSVASDTWVIAHSFPYRPDLEVYSISGELLYADETFPDAFTVVVSFAFPMTGFARLS